MDTPTRTPEGGTPAPYGHACSNCARAKCKCIIRGGDTCERCRRIGIACTAAPPVRRRGAKQSAASARIAQLEGTVSELVSLLRAQQTTNTPLVTTTEDDQRADDTYLSNNGSLSIDGVFKALPDLSRGWSKVPVSPNSQILSPDTAVPCSIPRAPESNPGAANFRYEISATKAEECLEIFRTHHLSFLPYLYIPASVTAQEIQREKPFLWLTILAVSLRSPRQQAEVSALVHKALAKQVIEDGHRSIDLLLGTLTYASWAQYFSRGKPHLRMVGNIVEALVFDLRINKPWGNDACSCPKCAKPLFSQIPTSGNNPNTNQERRALLGCYINSSTTSHLIRDDPMRWSPSMEEAALKLSEAGDHLGDHVLVALARISNVANGATLLTAQHGQEAIHQGSPGLHISSLIASLRKVQTAFPAEVLQNGAVLSCSYNAEVLIYELALLAQHSSPFYHVNEFRRLEHLHSCVQSAKLCLENFKSFDLLRYPGMSFSVMVQSIRCLQTLYWLTLLEDPGWDRALVRATADVLYYVSQIAMKLEQAHHALQHEGAVSEENGFAKGAEKLRMAIDAWRPGIERATQGSASVPTASTGEDLPDYPKMDFWDDFIFADVLPSWDGPGIQGE